MSVLKNKRSVSSMEFYHNAIMLRKEITLLLLRDFGIKDKVRSIKALYGVQGMEPEDEKKFREIIAKYEMTAKIIEEYPAWIIDKMRSSMMNIMHNMIMNITQANTIYPVCESEFYDRRNFQNHAIGNCEQLLQEMQYIISIIPVDAQKYMRYVDMIEKEIALLKGLLNDIRGICDEYGLFINPKKTQIVKLSHGFTFLKIKYSLTETGKVIERISKDSVVRQRRKLKRLRKLLDEGKVSFADVRCSYASWRGGVQHYDSYTILKNMDKLFDELFIHPFIEGGHRNEQTNNEQK